MHLHCSVCDDAVGTNRTIRLSAKYWSDYIGGWKARSIIIPLLRVSVQLESDNESAYNRIVLRPGKERNKLRLIVTVCNLRSIVSTIEFWQSIKRSSLFERLTLIIPNLEQQEASNE